MSIALINETAAANPEKHHGFLHSGTLLFIIVLETMPQNNEIDVHGLVREIDLRTVCTASLPPATPDASAISVSSVGFQLCPCKPPYRFLLRGPSQLNGLTTGRTVQESQRALEIACRDRPP
jgi:hypothetical protein